jgi:hypothetical protein
MLGNDDEEIGEQEGNRDEEDNSKGQLLGCKGTRTSFDKSARNSKRLTENEWICKETQNFLEKFMFSCNLSQIFQTHDILLL